MRKLLVYTALITIVALTMGCALTNYPVITDDRGDFSGVIRTGHRAFVMPTSQIATLWSDGSDELVWLVFQNQYGDQKLYTKNNFDPTQSVIFVDQTYCDWRFETCVVVDAWNPANGPDDIFDYNFFTDCLGARSLSLLVSYGARNMECGDLFADKQGLAMEFSELATTTWRGGVAYVVPINAGTTSISFDAGDVSATMPMYGNFTAFITDKFQTVVPITPNARHELRWLQNFVAENGNILSANLNYNSLSATVPLRVRPEGIAANLDRF